LALLNLSIFLEQARDGCFGEAGGNASDEEIGAGVDSTIIILRSRVVLGSAFGGVAVGRS